MKIKKIFLIITLIVILMPLVKIFAYDIGNNSMTPVKSNMTEFGLDIGIADNQSLESKIIGYINILLGLLGFIFLVLIIIAGFRWMTSGGSEEIIKKAKGTIKSSIIGLAIILGAFIITNFVMSVLLENTQTNSTTTTQINP